VIKATLLIISCATFTATKARFPIGGFLPEDVHALES
jgi:hypothetical protein